MNTHTHSLTRTHKYTRGHTNTNTCAASTQTYAEKTHIHARTHSDIYIPKHNLSENRHQDKEIFSTYYEIYKLAN